MKIEAEMKKIIKEDLPLERFELSPEDAVKLMEEKKQDYKLELIAEHSGKGRRSASTSRASISTCAPARI